MIKIFYCLNSIQTHKFILNNKIIQDVYAAKEKIKQILNKTDTQGIIRHEMAFQNKWWSLWARRRARKTNFLCPCSRLSMNRNQFLNFSAQFSWTPHAQICWSSILTSHRTNEWKQGTKKCLNTKKTKLKYVKTKNFSGF